MSKNRALLALRCQKAFIVRWRFTILSALSPLGALIALTVTRLNCRGRCRRHPGDNLNPTNARPRRPHSMCTTEFREQSGRSLLIGSDQRTRLLPFPQFSRDCVVSMVASASSSCKQGLIYRETHICCFTTVSFVLDGKKAGIEKKW